VQTIRFFRRRGETLLDNERDEAADAVRDRLVRKVVQVGCGRGEGFCECEDGANVSVEHCAGFEACEVAEVERVFLDAGLVSPGAGFEEAAVGLDEGGVKVAGSAKV
jgi:hypothetical protein